MNPQKLNGLMLCTSLLLIFSIQFQQAQAQYLTKTWELSDTGEYLGADGLLIEDLDSDGSEEVLFTGRVHSYVDGFYLSYSRFFKLTYSDTSYEISGAGPIYPGDGYYSPEILVVAANLDGDNAHEIYALTNTGVIHVYNSQSLALVDSLALPDVLNPEDLRITDVDNDGQQEFVVNSFDANDPYFKVFDAQTLDLEWDTTGVAHFEIGDVTGDGMNEFVFSDGSVYDGASHERHWRFADGFGSMLTLTQTDDDPALEIVGYRGNYLLVAFDAELKTPLWEINIGDEPSALLAADTNGDGEWEIIVGPRYWGNVAAFSALTQEMLWSISSSEYGATNFALGDPDGDGSTNIVWGAGHYSSGPDRLYIADIQSSTIEYSSTDYDGPFLVQTGNFDGDEHLEIVAASNRSNSGYSGGRAIILDGIDQSVIGTSQTWPNLGYYNDFNGLGTADADGDGRHELYIGMDYQTLSLDEWPLDLRWESNNLPDGRVFVAGDIDQDGEIELVTGHSSGKVYILQGTTPDVEWESITTDGAIGGIELANIDEDEALEILFFNYGGRLHVYDGITHFLENQSIDIDDITAFDLVDADRDGQLDLFVGRNDGRISTLDISTLDAIDTFDAMDAPVSGLRVGNIDDTEASELVIGAQTLKVLSWPERDTLWESSGTDAVLGRQNSLHIADVDADGYMDILVAGATGVQQFEASVRYPDITPPTVREYAPAAGAVFVSRDIPAKFLLSETVSAENLASNIRVQANGADVSFNAELDQKELTISPEDVWPGEAELTVTLLGTLADSSDNGLDGNRNGIADGSPLDDMLLTFYTGTGIDSVGPALSITLEADSIWQGVPLRVSGIASDSSVVAISNLEAVEYFVDNMGDPGTGFSVLPADSLFDSVAEALQFSVDTETLSGGEHALFVRGKDVRGNWGSIASVSFNLITPGGSQWAMYGQNAQHTGFNAQDSIKAPLELDWSADLIEGHLTGAIVVNDYIYVTGGDYTTDKKVMALDAATGAEHWSFSFGSISGIAMPAFAYGRVYVQSINHSPGSYVSSFDAQTGSLLWQSPFGSQWSGGIAPTVANGQVFVNAGYYGGMTTYDAFTGEEQWFLNLPQDFNWAPTYYQGTVYAGWDNSSYYAIDSKSGEIDYQFGIPNWAGYTAVIEDSVIYTTNPLAAVDLETQSIRWSKSANVMPAVAYGKVFAMSGTTLYVYDAETGSTLWSVKLSDEDYELWYEPVVANGYVFVSSETRVHALDIENEEEVWSYDVGGRLAVANNRLYVASAGTLYAFKEGQEDTNPTSTASLTDVPDSYALRSNYPNPFNPQTTIPYELPANGPVRLEIYNTLGQWVATLVDGYQTAGHYEASWRASGLSSGQYFYRLTAGDFTEVRSMMLLK